LSPKKVVWQEKNMPSAPTSAVCNYTIYIGMTSPSLQHQESWQGHCDGGEIEAGPFNASDSIVERHQNLSVRRIKTILLLLSTHH
jgi:hypothetical protein